MQTATTIKSDFIHLTTRGNTDVVDITSKVSELVRGSGVAEGVVTLFVVGSTAGLTTIEYEPGLVQDLKEAFEKIAPARAPYHHHERWGDDNGHSHIRATLLGPDISIPFAGAELALGTWQQIILVDFDTRGRQREIVVRIIGH
jgi:secondary thiamine-phosphate synthase enzyme